MARKSSIVRAPTEVRATIDKLIRQGRLTLKEMRQYVTDQHGETHAPSQSALHRYSVLQREVIEKQFAINAASRALVEELGESPDDRGGALLVQAVTTLATDAALRAHDPDGKGASVDDIRKLARMARELISAQSINLKARQQIERMARERLQREQSENLDKLAAEQGMTHDQVEFWRKRFLGIS